MQNGESLFKKRIKQARKKQTNSQMIEESFPQAVAIDTCQQKQNPRRTFIQQMRNNSGLQQEQIQSIQQQNRNKVKHMSEVERKQYLQMINTQLPTEFVNTIKIKDKQIGEKNMQQQVHGAVQKLQKVKDNYKHNEGYKKQQHIHLIRQLRVGILADHLYFSTHETIPGQSVSVQQVQNMLYSENKQTVVIGSRLLQRIFHILITIPHYHYVVTISSINMHFLMLLYDLYEFLLMKMIQRISKNVFNTCHFEMLVSLCHITTAIWPYLTKNQQTQLYNIVQMQKDHISRVRSLHDEQSMTNIQQLINVVIQLPQSQPQSQINSIQKDINNMTTIVNRIVLEHTMHKQYQLQSYLQVLSRCYIQHTKSNQLILLIYIMVVTLKHYVNTLSHLSTLYAEVNSIVGSTLKQQLQNYQRKGQTGDFVKVLYILKQLDSEYLRSFSQQQTITNQQFYAILYVSIDSYCYQQLNQKEVQHINGMVKWLTSNISHNQLYPTAVFMDLICIFTSQSQLYTQLNQHNINELLKILTARIGPSDSIVITQSLVNGLIRSYSYSSLGNSVFTRLMLYLCMKLDSCFQGIIIVQLIQRYVYLFYLACNEQVYGDISLYRYRNSNKDEKQQVISMLKQHGQLIQFPNILTKSMNGN